jgi:hypothetical protein
VGKKKVKAKAEKLQKAANVKWNLLAHYYCNAAFTLVDIARQPTPTKVCNARKKTLDCSNVFKNF